MIAQLFWGFTVFCAFKVRYHPNIIMCVYLTLNHPCIKLIQFSKHLLAVENVT